MGSTERAKLVAWKKLWESDAGKDAIERMERLKEQNLLTAMNVNTNVVNPAEWVQTFTSRAAGIQLVLDEIARGIQLLEEEQRKEQEGGDST